MRVVLIGQRDGKRIIRWRAVLLLAIFLGLLGALFAAGSYWLFAGEISMLAVMMGFWLNTMVIASGVYRSMQLPIAQLTQLETPAN